MGKLCNVIFYKDSWGRSNVIHKEHEIENIPDVGEIVVLSDSVDDTYYSVVERVFDFADNIVHMRVSPNRRIYDLTTM